MACKVMWYGGLTDNKNSVNEQNFLLFWNLKNVLVLSAKFTFGVSKHVLPKKLHEWNLRLVPRTGMGTSVYICSCGVVGSCGNQNATPGKGRSGRCLWPIRWDPPPPPWTDMTEKITFCTQSKPHSHRVFRHAISREPISAIVAELCDGW